MRVIVSRNAPSHGAAQAGTLMLHPGHNLLTGESPFTTAFDEISSLETDLLTLAAAVFASDVAVKRGMREDIVRDIELTVPVVNFHALDGAKEDIEEILHILSHDNWTLRFERDQGTPEPLAAWPASDGKALLFSGGLDSLAGAVDLLDEHGTGGVLLASHVTRNTITIASQNRLHEYLEARYGGAIRRVVVRAGGRESEDAVFAEDGQEVTQRTRSFLFLTIAALSARRSGMSTLVMIAENGQMAIHLPISAGRIGAFSTHTAHPSFVAKASAFFSSALQFPIKIENPYLYSTKAEVVRKLVADHASAVPLSVSCWKSSRVATGHCGECVPCYIRRISLEFNGSSTQGWARDVFAEDVGTLPPTDEGKRNLVELASFAADFRDMTAAELDMEYCELYSSYFDRTLASDMYRRFGEEAKAVMLRYPNLSFLL